MADDDGGEDTPDQHRGLKEPWKPGQSGNPAGRPKGKRNKLAEAFWSDLADAWQAKGKAAIDAMIDKNPGDFVKVVATQMPKELLLKTADMDDVSDEELAEFIATVRSVTGSGDTKTGRSGNGRAAGKEKAGGKPH